MKAASQIIEMPSFVVIGISCRTNNARESKGEGCIGKQWDRLFSEGLLGKVPERVDENMVAVYTDYAGDKDGEYTYLLGAKVLADALTPEGMVKVTIPDGNYAVFTSERGPAQQVVPATWKHVWESGQNRAYKSDFEIYDERAADPNNAVVDIYVGVR